MGQIELGLSLGQTGIEIRQLAAQAQVQFDRRLLFFRGGRRVGRARDDGDLLHNTGHKSLDAAGRGWRRPIGRGGRALRGAATGGRQEQGDDCPHDEDRLARPQVARVAESSLRLAHEGFMLYQTEIADK